MSSFPVHSKPSKGDTRQPLNESLTAALTQENYTLSDGSPILWVHELPEKIVLRKCKSVVDVSPLGYGRVKTLRLSWCTGITDVSALGGVETLILTGCTSVVDVSSLCNVEHLDLWGCTGVVDVSALGRVQCLILTGCTSVVDVSALGGVELLNLSG